jgi:hypothetical protein
LKGRREFEMRKRDEENKKWGLIDRKIWEMY